MIIGITGGTGCGKTTLLNLIRQHGGMVLDCDAIYHDLLKNDKALLNAIESRFPGVVANGALQRKKLGQIVFSDPVALQDLNRITHGAIKDAVKQALSVQPELAAIDAIALLESGLADLCDVTVAICAPEEDRLHRLMCRDGITREYAQSRIAAQPSNDYYRQNCQYTLENNADLDAFATKCVAFLRNIGIMVP